MEKGQIKRIGSDNILRKLIPYDAFTIKTRISKINIVGRLTDNVSSKAVGGFKGEVHEYGFSLQQKSSWYISNRLPPFFVGRIEEKGNGTVIRIKVLNPFHVSITVLVYFLIVAFFVAASLSFLGFGIQPFPPIAFLIAIGAFGIIFLWNREFQSDVKSSKERLFDIFGLKDLSRDMGEFPCPACGNPIHEDEERCLKCGWTYKNHQE
jgi:hypothetical protein